MKLSKFLTTLVFTATLAVSQMVDLSNPKQVQAQTSGCGSGSSWYLLRILSPIGSSQFRVACNEHDACYDTLGKSQQECDKAFHNRMLGICAKDHNTWFGKPLKIACNGRADAYYTAVMENGGNAYNDGQAKARASQPTITPDIVVNIRNGYRLIFDRSKGTGFIVTAQGQIIRGYNNWRPTWTIIHAIRPDMVILYDPSGEAAIYHIAENADMSFLYGYKGWGKNHRSFTNVGDSLVRIENANGQAGIYRVADNGMFYDYKP